MTIEETIKEHLEKCDDCLLYPHGIPMKNQNNWEEELMKQPYVFDDGCIDGNVHDVIDFITSQISKAYQEGRNEIIKQAAEREARRKKYEPGLLRETWTEIWQAGVYDGAQMEKQNSDKALQSQRIEMEEELEEALEDSRNAGFKEGILKSKEWERQALQSQREEIIEALKGKELSPGVTNGKSSFTAEDVYKAISLRNR